MQEFKGGYNKPKTDKIDSRDYIFGTRAVIEALRSGRQLDKILLQKDLKNELISELKRELKTSSIPVVNVPVEKLNRVTKKNHQGVIAHVSLVNYAKLSNVVAAAYERGKVPFFLLLDRITDVRNFGAIARTAECLGVDAIVIPEKGSAQINSDAVKTSAGALNHIPVCREKSLVSAVHYLKESGIRVIACTEKTDQSMYTVDMATPLAIVMGSEEDGIGQDILKLVDDRAKIPMLGAIASLNVSVSAGVILYEAARQREEF